MIKHKLFVTVFTTTHWIKPDLPGEPILFTSKLVMGACRATLAKPAGS